MGASAGTKPEACISRDAAPGLPRSACLSVRSTRDSGGRIFTFGIGIFTLWKLQQVGSDIAEKFHLSPRGLVRGTFRVTDDGSQTWTNTEEELAEQRSEYARRSVGRWRPPGHTRWTPMWKLDELIAFPWQISPGEISSRFQAHHRQVENLLHRAQGPLQHVPPNAVSSDIFERLAQYTCDNRTAEQNAIAAQRYEQSAQRQQAMTVAAFPRGFWPTREAPPKAADNSSALADRLTTRLAALSGNVHDGTACVNIDPNCTDPWGSPSCALSSSPPRLPASAGAVSSSRDARVGADSGVRGDDGRGCGSSGGESQGGALARVEASLPASGELEANLPVVTAVATSLSR